MSSFFNDKDSQQSNDFYNPNVLINLGPSHPAMHGTLRVMCRINGETIEDAACEIGYLHRAIEKLGEDKTYHQWMVYTDRLNYCSALNNNIAREDVGPHLHLVEQLVTGHGVLHGCIHGALDYLEAVHGAYLAQGLANFGVPDSSL